MDITIQDLLELYLEKYASKNPVPIDILKSARRIMYCRTERLGGHKHTCPKCGEKKITYNSCRNKNCPLCNNVAQENWLNKELKRLPDVSYNHLIFTVPHEFNKYYRSNKRLFCNLLFESVKESLFEVIDKKHNLTCGHKLQMHTNDQLLGIHLHIHSMSTLGGIDENGDWKELKYLVWIPKLIDVYREKLIKKLQKHINEFELFELKSELHNELSRLSKKKWKIHLAKEFEKHSEELLKYFSKRAKGCFISNKRILGRKNGRILIEYKDKKRKQKKIAKLEPLEFIRRFLYHIPSRGQKLNRNYGLFHHRNAEELLKLVEDFGSINPNVEEIKEAVKCEKCKTEMENIEEILPLNIVRFSQLKLDLRKVGNLN